MAYWAHEYVKLSLVDPAVSRDHWVSCLRATADFYGWTEAFPRWRQKSWEVNGKWYSHHPSARTCPPHRGGRRLRICRVASTIGTPAGKTNCFRVSSHCTNADLARLALATKVEWGWMESYWYERRKRATWLAMAAELGEVVPGLTRTSA